MQEALLPDTATDEPIPATRRPLTLASIQRPTCADDVQKMKFAKGTILITSALFVAAYAVNLYAGTMSTAIKISAPIISMLGILFTIRSSGPIDTETPLYKKFKAALIPILIFSAIDFSNIVLFFNTIIHSHSFKDSLLLGMMGIAANFKAMFTRHAIENPNWRLEFTPEQTKLRRNYSAQFIVPYLCIFAAVSATYLSLSTNTHKKSVVAIEAASLLCRLGYQYCVTKPTETAWKYRAKSSFGEGLSMAACFLISVVGFTYITKGKSSLTPDYFLNAMMLKAGLGVRYYYESFLSLGSPSGLDLRQLLRWGRSTPDDVRESTTFRYCGCCCPGKNLTQLQYPTNSADGQSSPFTLMYQQPATNFRPVSGVPPAAPEPAPDMA